MKQTIKMGTNDNLNRNVYHIRKDVMARLLLTHRPGSTLHVVVRMNNNVSLFCTPKSHRRLLRYTKSMLHVVVGRNDPFFWRNAPRRRRVIVVKERSLQEKCLGTRNASSSKRERLLSGRTLPVKTVVYKLEIVPDM